MADTYQLGDQHPFAPDWVDKPMTQEDLDDLARLDEALGAMLEVDEATTGGER